MSGACRRAPFCRVLPHFAALEIRRISLTAIRISVYGDSCSRSHNTEVSVCNMLMHKHLQMTYVLPNTEVTCSPQYTSVCRARASNRHAPASPDTPRCAIGFLKALQPNRLRWGDLRYRTTVVVSPPDPGRSSACNVPRFMVVDCHDDAAVLDRRDLKSLLSASYNDLRRLAADQLPAERVDPGAAAGATTVRPLRQKEAEFVRSSGNVVWVRWKTCDLAD